MSADINMTISINIQVMQCKYNTMANAMCNTMTVYYNGHSVSIYY